MLIKRCMQYAVKIHAVLSDSINVTLSSKVIVDNGIKIVSQKTYIFSHIIFTVKRLNILNSVKEEYT